MLGYEGYVSCSHSHIIFVNKIVQVKIQLPLYINRIETGGIWEKIRVKSYVVDRPVLNSHLAYVVSTRSRWINVIEFLNKLSYVAWNLCQHRNEVLCKHPLVVWN